MATLYVSCLGLVFLSRFRGGKWRTMRVIETAAELRAVILENGDNDPPVSDSSLSMTQDVVCSGPMDPRDP
jgi:hypothetical protein